MNTHHQRGHLSLLMQPVDDTAASDSGENKGRRDAGLEEDAGLVLLLEALASPVRFRLLRLLTREEGTLCVRELVERIPRSQPVISHHLRILLFAGFLGVKRLGNHAYYYILSDKLKEVREGLVSVEHLLQQRREDQH